MFLLLDLRLEDLLKKNKTTSSNSNYSKKKFNPLLCSNIPSILKQSKVLQPSPHIVEVISSDSQAKTLQVFVSPPLREKDVSKPPYIDESSTSISRLEQPTFYKPYKKMIKEPLYSMKIK